MDDTVMYAATASRKWKDVIRVFDVNMIAVYERDLTTDLSPFMLTAKGMKLDLETGFRLCREYAKSL